jgi:hypothetical protein
VIRSGVARLIFVTVLASPLWAQGPADLQVQLRWGTGSDRFQIGEVIPLEVTFSSSAPNRYLAPCALFWEGSFGFPQCRFSTAWSFTITPDTGWVDLTKEFPSGVGTFSGPVFEVPSHDLSSEPETLPYVLTKRFRFDKPGEYHVSLSMQVGLDDETTAFRDPFHPSTVKPHSVPVTPEIVLQIVAASAEWESEIIRKGYAAYSAPAHGSTNPPSPGKPGYQKDTQALCNLGTPEAARVLARLLSQQHSEIQSCLDYTPSADAAIQEMQRLLVDPDFAVEPVFFSVLVRLLSRDAAKVYGASAIAPEPIDRERELLLSALPQKRGAGQVASLLTLLQWPVRAKGTAFESGYDLPFSPAVIAEVAADFDRIPWYQQQWLLEDAWARVNSPLMLPLVRRLAEAGDGPALLRWIELEPATATEFVRKEVVRPVPRFSSFYLRLPDASVPGQEAQLAANFIALTRDQDLFRAATLLHRYATAAVLPVVLPFIDAKHAGWSCTIQYPVLAYLLKVSPTEAAPRLEELLQKTNHEPWQTTFFTDIGFLEPSPVLEKLAMVEIEAGTQPLARDAIEYLQVHGTVAVKPFLWKQLVLWQEKLAASKARRLAKNSMTGNEEQADDVMVSELSNALISTQAWILSEEDTGKLEALLGAGSWASSAVARTPGIYSIRGAVNSAQLAHDRPEYMNPTERYRYSIFHYRCADIRTLKEKMLEFPAGSSFDFGSEFSAADSNELAAISEFAISHGYKITNLQNWSFLRSGASR